jgi:hypothetical protein
LIISPPNLLTELRGFKPSEVGKTLLNPLSGVHQGTGRVRDRFALDGKWGDCHYHFYVIVITRN